MYAGKKAKDAFYKCARATTLEYFNLKMEKMKDKHYGAWSWVENKAPSAEHWSKAYFNTICKSDITTSNHVEIFNKFILEARSLPIIDMLEMIRLLLQKRIRTNRDVMRRYPGLICPRIVEKLDKARKYASGFIAYWNGGHRYEICGPTYKVVVDLETRTCACRRWQLTGIPCSHAMRAIMDRSDDPDDYVHECYHKTSYLRSYENLIEGMNGPELWLHSSKQPLIEPIVTAQPGRPKKKRNKKNDEKKHSGPIQKIRVLSTIKCSNCGGLGHNIRSCKEGGKQKNEASTSGLKKLPVRRKK